MGPAGIFFTTQPFESLLQSGVGWSWRTLTLGPGETGIGQHKRLGTPFHCPPILLAPVPEAAVLVTSSHKHALFLRKWKVSEVWWGAGSLQRQCSGLPLSYSPLRRDPTGAPGAPAFSAFTTLTSNSEKSGKVGRGCLSRFRGLCRACKGTWQEVGRGHCPVHVSPLAFCLSPPPPRASQFFPFFLPLAGKKLTSGPPAATAAAAVTAKTARGWCDQRHSRGGRDEDEGPAGEVWLSPACRVSFLPEPKLSLASSCCLADSPGRGGPTSRTRSERHSSDKHLSSTPLFPASVASWGGGAHRTQLIPHKTPQIGSLDKYPLI